MAMSYLKAVLISIVMLMTPALTASGADEKKPQPVLILLYSRFDDHVMMPVTEQRIFHLTGLLDRLKKTYPKYPAPVSCEFSGTVAKRIIETPTLQGYLKQLKELAAAGRVDFGYSGENEPTYRNRPKAALTPQMKPEQRWLEQTTTAEHFLNDFKAFYTGAADSSKPGGVRQMRETFGDPAILAGFAPQLGGEAPYLHQLRRMNIQAIVPGFPDPYFTMNIHGYRGSAKDIGKEIAPVPEASPEVFWDSGYLRASFTDDTDIRGLQADEGKEAIEKVLKGLDRSHVRVIQMEVAGYARYLAKWPDGTPKLHPLTWAYDHPDEPLLPSGVRAFNQIQDVEKAYQTEEAVLGWLLGEWLPANPGSRIVRPQEILKMAQTPVGSDVSRETLTALAKDWVERSVKAGAKPPTFVAAESKYYTTADMFQLLANALAGMNKTGKVPEKLHLTHIYGPFRIEDAEEKFPTATFTLQDVQRVAADLAPQLNDQTWRPVPLNAVPSQVVVAGKRMNPAQFAALMVDALLAQSPDAKLKLRYLEPLTAPAYVFPRQTSILEAGNLWTLRPAPLKLQ